MAASLLGPLIPSEVKEAEEKWRKRLLKGLDEPENTPDSEGEGAHPAGSPANPLQDPESAPTVQKELCIKKQSGENVHAEEEPEEDTMELELALERKKVRGERDLCATLMLSGITFKPFFSVPFYLFLFIWQMFMAAVCGSNLLSDFKAELRALEEGDGSAGGSSPCSETSQEASAHGLLLKKNRWKTAFPCAASPDSSSRGSDLQDNTETGECMQLQASYWRVVCITAVNGYLLKIPFVYNSNQKILHAFLTFWPVAASKVLESVAEGEDKEKDSGEETTVTKPLGKEEAEVSELKVETPELKVK